MYTGFLFGTMIMFWNETVIMIAQLCECTINHQIVHFKHVNFMVCELHLNKPIILQKKKSTISDFPGGTVVKNLPANAGDMG